MPDVFVFNNPGNMTFNSYVLLFIRAWYLPWDPIEDVPQNDTWMRMPAFRSSHNGRPSYLTINSRVEALSPIMIAEQDNLVLRSGGGTANKPVNRGMILSILDNAFDVSTWEKENQASYPYKDMLDREAVAARYAIKTGGSFSDIDDRNFKLVKSMVTPRPCRNCGRRRGRQ